MSLNTETSKNTWYRFLKNLEKNSKMYNITTTHNLLSNTNFMKKNKEVKRWNEHT